ncbi:HU family DNA-binding protein [Bacteroides oleiciplenus]|uniref:DNA-binding protein n=1 Tax=Bacteroides oleiciplenus TaxID=626931 RepID=A0A3E5B1B8_9BACE|nr:HU family DNA-binding protein [Bacteroides oleiciplenus]RGN31388.1 DNA-binding protein [Bacteroides oleiciplenus]
MAIVYDWYENPNAEGDPEERGLHPRPLLNGKVSMKQLYARVHARSSLTVGDVMNAIDCLTQICSEELREGREVHIEGLGYFSPTLEATQKVTRSTPNKHLKLRLKSISFRPDVNLKSALTGITTTRSKYTRHSQRLSEVEIDMRLKEYFAEHDILIRYDFQNLCGMARTTANGHLKRLLEEGKLMNVGRRTQPIYRPMPGYYGVSRDAKVKR